MKKYIFIFFVFYIATSTPAFSQFDNVKNIEHCRVSLDYGWLKEEFELWGNVRIVSNPNEFAHFRVKVVNDPKITTLWVKIVDNPSECGEWKWVQNKKQEKFSIRFVDEYEHFSIMFIDDKETPGCRF